MNADRSEAGNLQRLMDAMPQDARRVAQAILDCVCPDEWLLELDCEADGYEPDYYLRVETMGRGSWRLATPVGGGKWHWRGLLIDDPQGAVLLSWPPYKRQERCEACWVQTGKPRVEPRWRDIDPADVIEEVSS